MEKHSRARQDVRSRYPASTLDALFNGQQELFEGLYIYDKWDWTQKIPGRPD
jgi:hypothetical protein